MKHKFIINEDVLIPRPETELIIEQALKYFRYKSNVNFLDIGVGSGCIILSILKEKEIFGTGIDLSDKCLNLSKINADKLGLKIVKFFKSDVDNFNIGKYDLIISNPPYIKKLDLKYLDKDVIDYDKNGFKRWIRGFIRNQKSNNKSSELIKNGKLILEIAFDQRKRKRIIKKRVLCE